MNLVRLHTLEIDKAMFGIFKKKSEKDKLRNQYEKLLKEAHGLSTTNRKMSDQKAFEADEIMKKIEKLS
ncbi:Lacal_2735 family protein [Maribacter sp. Asnod1-A12]|uniref:Lacal_2735 family protein n=1 Tax=Maribacter sp. Asnod1-A12 TaxID=3160576 RepID=UPI003870C270